MYFNYLYVNSELGKEFKNVSCFRRFNFPLIPEKFVFINLYLGKKIKLQRIVFASIENKSLVLSPKSGFALPLLFCSYLFILGKGG